jgi:predicted AAA+ superfamily ATPase
MWDYDKKSPRLKKAAKYHVVNCLAASAWHPQRPRHIGEFAGMSGSVRGAWYEWAVAQELWRRSVLHGAPEDKQVYYWKSKNHEVDFIYDADMFYEVKAGAASPSEFLWFPKSFPNEKLTVISSRRFKSAFCTGITLEDFLSQPA